MKEELQQLETRKVMEPTDGNEITREEKMLCLQYLMFLKQKKKRKDQRTWMRRWPKAAQIHNKRGIKRTNHLNRGIVFDMQN